MTNKEEELRGLLLEAVQEFPEFDWNMDLPEGTTLAEADVNGGDLVDWFAQWRERVRTALGMTERMRPPVCEGCDGTGVRDHAHPSCTIPFLNAGWRVIEKCDACDKFEDDLEAAKSVAKYACWATCLNGCPHAIGNGAQAEEESTVTCSLCSKPCKERTAHVHQDEWIGDECCWDERLRATE